MRCHASVGCPVPVPIRATRELPVPYAEPEAL